MVIVEIKRLDLMTWLALYGSFAGRIHNHSSHNTRSWLSIPTNRDVNLSTMHAYWNLEQFIRNAVNGLYLEDRAYYITITVQQLLMIRLDIFWKHLGSWGCALCTGISSYYGSWYTLTITQIFCEFWKSIFPHAHLPWLNSLNGIPVRSDINAVERVLVYIELPLKPSWDSQWPTSVLARESSTKFEEGWFQYQTRREGGDCWSCGSWEEFLDASSAPVRTRISFLLLFSNRTHSVIELQSSKIQIDGRNIREMGLDIQQFHFYR